MSIAQEVIAQLPRPLKFDDIVSCAARHGGHRLQRTDLWNYYKIDAPEGFSFVGDGSVLTVEGPRESPSCRDHKGLDKGPRDPQESDFLTSLVKESGPQTNSFP